ncbi:MAG TPA: protein-glutamate O-methyltransferase [Kofleriaceae bacterium]|nr:protein-glutamate O-methyltransferase [Kofleriaceae bacterium]
MVATAPSPRVELLPLGDREFRTICALVRERAGIELGEAKRTLCQTRLMRRLRALGLTDYADYVALLDDPHSSERVELINALTTNVTAFFREPHHFELLASEILPALATPGRRVRLWSAGCSTGEEPWSLAMVVRELLGDRGVDVKILATDIDTEVLARARAGIYSDEHIAPVPAPRRQRFLQRGTGRNAGLWRVSDELRTLVVFNQLNLFDAWPMRGLFDVIACRNVIIYFDVPNKARLLRGFHGKLGPGGHLLLGHSESLTAGVAGFTACGRTAYRKTGA